jgi:hypothetical protein
MEQNELTYIKVEYPAAKDLHLKIVTPICSLVVSPGIGKAWVTGRYDDPKLVAPLSISQSNNGAQITAVGAFAYRTPPRFLPSMKLTFGRSRLFSLSISAGTMSDHLDFGGLPLTSLEFESESGSQFIDFSYPNPQAMSRMKIEGDTGPFEICNVENANAEKILLAGDSTDYHVKFNSSLKRNTTLRFGASVSKVEISVPAGTAIKIKPGGPPTGSHQDDFARVENAYMNTPAREKQEPLLTIQYAASGESFKIRYI